MTDDRTLKSWHEIAALFICEKSTLIKKYGKELKARGLVIPHRSQFGQIRMWAYESKIRDFIQEKIEKKGGV